MQYFIYRYRVWIFLVIFCSILAMRFWFDYQTSNQYMHVACKQIELINQTVTCKDY